MATTAVLRVTLPGGDPDRASPVPDDIVSLLAAAGQPTGHGWSRHGDQPWRLHYQLTGPDRVSIGQALEAKLRTLGYEADVSFA